VSLIPPKILPLITFLTNAFSSPKVPASPQRGSRARVKDFPAGNVATSHSRMAFLRSLCPLKNFQKMVKMVHTVVCPLFSKTISAFIRLNISQRPPLSPASTLLGLLGAVARHICQRTFTLPPPSKKLFQQRRKIFLTIRF
jgi:hypothetical protein